MSPTILAINTGSSSLKFSLFRPSAAEEQLVLDGQADGIGRERGTLQLREAGGRILRSGELRNPSQQEALRQAAEWLAEAAPEPPAAVGHRVVHGGPRLLEHQAITAAVLDELRACVHLAPLHIPAALELIQAAERLYPDVPQFACFDTAFHRNMPETSARFPLPSDLFAEGIRRYGFHGLSYESIVYQLGRSLPGRTVIAHLGNGASVAAVSDGQSIDTTMGLGPTGGIPMGTRSGDLDPSVLLYLMRSRQMNSDALEQMLNHRAGLAALSNGQSDMRSLEAATQAGDRAADLTIEIFCVAVRKMVGAYAAVMGGLDLLVFTGGIGEHSAEVRKRVCRGLDFLGISLNSPKVRILPSQEDLQIARHCRSLLQ